MVTKPRKKLNLILWVVIFVCAVCVVALSYVPVQPENELLSLLFYMCGLLPIFGFSVLGLVLLNQNFFSTWLGWSIPVLGIVIGGIPFDNSILGLWAITLFLISNFALAGSTFVFFKRHNYGLSLQVIGWLMIVYIWALVFAWRFQGNLIDLWTLSLLSQDSNLSLWWLNSLCCISMWIIPFGIAFFLYHSILLIHKEFFERA